MIPKRRWWKMQCQWERILLGQGEWTILLGQDDWTIPLGQGEWTILFLKETRRTIVCRLDQIEGRLLITELL